MGKAAGWATQRDFGDDERAMSLAALEHNRILVGCLDGKLRIWDHAAGKLLKTLDAHQVGIYALALHPSGKKFASGAIDSTILEWDSAVLEP